MEIRNLFCAGPQREKAIPSYKSLRSFPNPEMLVRKEKLRFTHKPFPDLASPRHSAIKQKIKEIRHLSAADLNPCKNLRKSFRKNKLSIPTSYMDLKSFDILSPVQEKIEEIEKQNKLMQPNFKKAIDDIKSISESVSAQEDSELVHFSFPKFQKSPLLSPRLSVKKALIHK